MSVATLGRTGVRFWATGNRTGGCTRCGRVFQGETAFARHQTHEDGQVQCLDPATVVDKDGKPVFLGKSGTHGFDTEVTYWSLASSARLGVIFGEEQE